MKEREERREKREERKREKDEPVILELEPLAPIYLGICTPDFKGSSLIKVVGNMTNISHNQMLLRSNIPYSKKIPILMRRLA